MEEAPSPENSLSVFHLLPWFNVQIERLADGLVPDLSLSGPDAVKAFVQIETERTMALLRSKRSLRCVTTMRVPGVRMLAHYVENFPERNQGEGR